MKAKELRRRGVHNWDRLLWGVVTGTHDKRVVEPDRVTGLLGQGWHAHRPGFYHGEPAVPLLFVSRRAARDWCQDKMEKYANHSDCKFWWFRPVRVRERVEIQGSRRP